MPGMREGTTFCGGGQSSIDGTISGTVAWAQEGTSSVHTGPGTWCVGVCMQTGEPRAVRTRTQGAAQSAIHHNRQAGSPSPLPSQARAHIVDVVSSIAEVEVLSAGHPVVYEILAIVPAAREEGQAAG